LTKNRGPEVSPNVAEAMLLGANVQVSDPLEVSDLPQHFVSGGCVGLVEPMTNAKALAAVPARGRSEGVRRKAIRVVAVTRRRSLVSRSRLYVDPYIPALATSRHLAASSALETIASTSSAEWR